MAHSQNRRRQKSLYIYSCIFLSIQQEANVACRTGIVYYKSKHFAKTELESESSKKRALTANLQKNETWQRIRKKKSFFSESTKKELKNKSANRTLTAYCQKWNLQQIRKKKLDCESAKRNLIAKLQKKALTANPQKRTLKAKTKEKGTKQRNA